MRPSVLVTTAAAMAALVVVSGHAQTAHDGAVAFAPSVLVAPPSSGWPTNGGNLYNQRYSPLTTINRTNVGQLEGVWRTRLRGSGTAPQYSGFAQPVVVDGVAYVSTGADDVFALSIETGDIVWAYAANLDPANTSVCCGWNNKGVAVSEDSVFVGQLDGKLVALDRATGKVAWSVQAERWQENFSITAAPVYYKGLVIVGFAGADRGTRGRVKAYDAKDGHLVWTFYTIPGPGESGHDTWPKDNDAWKYGGGSVWQTPAVDPDLGLVYFSTGNAGPDYNGAVRRGDNLYTASIVAVDAVTGKYRWHFQQVHHDIWDYDATNPVVLMDVRVGGRTRKAIAEVNKTGWAYILDRQTGKPLIGIDEKPVPQEPRQATAATQPIPRGDAIVPQMVGIAPEGMTLVNDGRIFTPFVGKETTLVTPGIWGGANWPPSSYDPVQQLLFVCASSVVNGYTGGGDPNVVPPGHTTELYNGGATVYTRIARYGIVAAVDVTTNTLKWRYQWPEQCYSGTLATAGGLLFVGRNDGRLTALDSSTGRQLWEFQTGAGMHAPASTFAYKGKQYVLAFSAGSALIGSARGDSVWLFGLGGTLPPAQPGAVVPRSTSTAAAPAAAPVRAAAGPADLTRGKQIFEQACVVCHGTDGKGGHGAGAPLDALTDVAAAMQTVTNGRNNMPSFATTFTPDQIRDVSAYVVGVLASHPAPSSENGAVLTTPHFAFYSDLQTNVHDALIEASGARRTRRPELFQEGAEKACFDRLSTADREAWNAAVDAYGSRRVTGSQQVLIRMQLARLLRQASVGDSADASFLEETTRNQVAATPAYQQCRWTAQDALNRRWIATVQTQLARDEEALGRELPGLFRTPWVGVPFRVDVVNTAPPTGGSTASPDGNVTAHILVSSTNEANQGDAALEVVFHEASHALSREDSPLAMALASAARDTGVQVPPGLLHSVHFFMTGEAVSRALAKHGETYTPDLFRLKLFGDRFREVVGPIWASYMDGKQSLDGAAHDLVRALAAPGKGV